MYGKSSFRRIVNSSVVSVRTSKNDNTKRLLDVLANMPKPQTSRIAEAQRQRKQISKKGEKYSPSVVYLQVLGSGARGVPNTLYMFTDQKRYLFNCGESTQRLAHEHKVKLSRLNDIFITSKTWKNIGGLPGLSLTLQDVGVPNITLHGPVGLDELYNATKRFVIMKNMEVTMAKCSTSEDFEDSVMSVRYIYLTPHNSVLDVKEYKQAAKKQKLNEIDTEEYKEFIMDDIDYYNPNSFYKKLHHKHNVEKKDKLKDLKDKMQKTSSEFYEKALSELRKKSDCTVAYICTLKKRLGTLNLEKCVELGVKPGPLLGQLKAGHDVMLPDGRLVFASDVKTPDEPGPVFIVIEVPEISYLKPLEFNMYFDNKDNPPENIPALVVHYTPPQVVALPQYQRFMSQFGPRTRHLMLNTGNSCLGSEAVHRTQHRLHLLDSDIFPLLRDVSIPAMWKAQPPQEPLDTPKHKCREELKNKIAMAQFQSIIEMANNIKEKKTPSDSEACGKPPDLIEARTMTIFHLRPKQELDRSMEPKLHIQDYIQEAMDADGFTNSLEQFRRVAEFLKSNVTSSEYPKVVFLGTGSCIPSKTRNTSAIVVQVDEHHSLLLDCGEGTFSQLVRFYSQKRINHFLRTLKAIYISHLHADHHIGLISILQERRAALQEANMDPGQHPLYLLAPGQIMSWLSVYDHKFERIRTDFTLIPNQSLLRNRENLSELTPSLVTHLGLSDVQTCLVSHCPNAFGVALVAGEHKITYSGDTVPCEDLIKLGKDSSLLIHEATMEDELAAEARLKMHSTTTQAINVGNRMDARYIILTHFSQRYARLPRLNSNILNGNKKVGIAFDNMKVTMGDLDLLPHMYAPLQLMFAEHCVEMEVKATHRALAKNRGRDHVGGFAKYVRFGKGGCDDSEIAKETLRKNCRKTMSMSATIPMINSRKEIETLSTLKRHSKSFSTAKKKESESRSAPPLNHKPIPTPAPVAAKTTDMKTHTSVPAPAPQTLSDMLDSALTNKRSPIKTTCNRTRESPFVKMPETKLMASQNKPNNDSIDSESLLFAESKQTISTIREMPEMNVEKQNTNTTSNSCLHSLNGEQQNTNTAPNRYRCRDSCIYDIKTPKQNLRKSFVSDSSSKGYPDDCSNLDDFSTKVRESLRGKKSLIPKPVSRTPQKAIFEEAASDCYSTSGDNHRNRDVHVDSFNSSQGKENFNFCRRLSRNSMSCTTFAGPKKPFRGADIKRPVSPAFTAKGFRRQLENIQSSSVILQSNVHAQAPNKLNFAPVYSNKGGKLQHEKQTTFVMPTNKNLPSNKLLEVSNNDFNQLKNWIGNKLEYQKQKKYKSCF